MATQLDPNVKDDLKTQFVTREGTYRLLQFSEYSRPNRVGYSSNQSSPQVRVSIVSLPNPSSSNGSGTTNSSEENSAGCNSNKSQNQQIVSNLGNNSSLNRDVIECNRINGISSHYSGGVGAGIGGVQSSIDSRLGAGISMHSMMNGCAGVEQGCYASQIIGGDRICFNFGRELYVYAFRGIKKGTEMSKPIDKKFYKGTNPSCHDFNLASATPTGAPLLVGFTTGQIQLVSPQPGPRELRKLYNEERLIDKSKVTCLKWLPNSPNLFLASHASGHLYLYNEELPCIATAPNYQTFKVGDGYTILTCKSKSTRNPLYKWVFNTENCCINEFCFSPCGSNLAIVSQDGFLRVFHYDTMELLGIARSYFGGFLCVCWSPDGKYIVVGGEDDLVTVWSFHERRVVARGQGHRSWVSVVAFDPYTTSYTNWDGGDFSDDENQINEYHGTRDSRFSGDSSAGNGFDGFVCNDKASTPVHTRHNFHSASFRSDASSSTQFNPDKLNISYRLGSVSQDTQLCLWDITEDILRHPLSLRQRVNSSSCNANDSSYMNGGLNSDGVRVIRPIAIGNTSSSFPPPQHTSSPTKDSNAAPHEPHSNSGSSKFSTANCTISSQSSNSNSPPDEAIQQHKNQNNKQTSSNSNSNSNSTSSGNTLKFANCIGSNSKPDTPDSLNNQKSNSSTSGYSSKTTTSSSSKHSDSSSGFSTLNSITQRLTNFSFLGSNNSDKKSFISSGNTLDGTSTQRNHRKTLSLLKPYHNSNSNNTNANNINNTSNNLDLSHPNSSTGNQATTTTTSGSSHMFGSIKLGKSSSNSHYNNSSNAGASGNNANVVLSYDPMKLIGTPACPRFDECPLLEPLVCKKIAHERLTALIFREDCFLTACQDGVIYTWARPGYTSHVAANQHLSPSQMAPPGGTVI